jgi:nitrogen regulatory protein P-II 1
MNYLILFVVDQIEDCPAVFDAWEEVGVSGITIWESTGLGRIRGRTGVRDDLPMMPSLRSLMQSREEHHRTLMTAVKDMETVDAVIAATESALGPLDQPNKGVILVLPLVRVVGASSWEAE